jgi:hypothetical protein
LVSFEKNIKSGLLTCSIRKSTFFWILDWMDDWTSNQIQLQKSKKVEFSAHVQYQKSKKIGFLDFVLIFCFFPLI